MKNNWLAKISEETMKFIKEILQTIKENYQLAPIISGGASLVLLNKIIFSNLEGEKFIWALGSVFSLFLVSAVLYYFLRRLEKDKDVYLLSVIGRTVGDVFKRYGQQMAVHNADNAKAEDMNKIMVTIIGLVKNMKNLADKKYRD